MEQNHGRHGHHGYDHHDDPKEVAAMLEVVAEKVPALLKGILNPEVLDVATKRIPELITNLLQTFYSPEAGSNMGKAIGQLYKELIDAGLPQDVAAKMASDYMISLKDLAKLAKGDEE